MALANQQQLCMQRVDVVDHRRVWSAGNDMWHCLDVAADTHFIVCQLRSRFFRHVPQWPCPVRKRFSNDHWRWGRWKPGL